MLALKSPWCFSQLDSFRFSILKDSIQFQTHYIKSKQRLALKSPEHDLNESEFWTWSEVNFKNQLFVWWNFFIVCWIYWPTFVRNLRRRNFRTSNKRSMIISSNIFTNMQIPTEKLILAGKRFKAISNINYLKDWFVKYHKWIS